MKMLKYLIGVSILLTACGQGKKPATKETTTQPVEKVKAVCIYSTDAVQEKPEKNAKYLSSLMLGEVMNYLGETVTDSTNNRYQYYHVELSDGSQVWARTYGILLNAYPAAVTHTTPIYKRPELVTKTNKNFNTMEFVAVTNDKDEWVEVTGMDHHKSGWIKKDDISTKNEDIAISTLAEKQILDKEGELQMDKVSAFLESLPYKNSRLIDFLQAKLTENVGDSVQNSIQNYEDNKNMN